MAVNPTWFTGALIKKKDIIGDYVFFAKNERKSGSYAANHVDIKT
jgi:hypothetical protein